MSFIPKVGGLIDLVKKNAKNNPEVLIGQNCSEFDDPELRKLCYEANSSNDKNGNKDEEGSNVAIIVTIVICILAIAGFFYFKIRK